MAEPVHATVVSRREERPDPEAAPLDPADFPGCRAARSRSRPKSRISGLTIHVLEGGRFREAGSSRAFPGWTAEEIHRALNEHTTSTATAAALHRVGAALGAAAGAGPDDDVWLRHYRDEGRAEGRAETRRKTVIALLEQRGMPTTPAFPARLAELGEIPETDLIRAALGCASETEFLEPCAALLRSAAEGGGGPQRM